MVKEQAKAIAELADAVRKLQVGDRKRKGGQCGHKAGVLRVQQEGSSKIRTWMEDASPPRKWFITGITRKGTMCPAIWSWWPRRHIWLYMPERRGSKLWTGCGSGRHRSVAVTEEVGDSLRGEGYQVIIEHQERDSWPRRSRQHRHPIVTEDWENRATDAFPQW